MSLCFSFNLERNPNRKLYHIPRKYFNNFGMYFANYFNLKVFLDGTFLGQDTFKNTSGGEFYLPIKYRFPSGIIAFELLIDDEAIRKIEDDPQMKLTIKETLYLSRIGQGKFRKDLITNWKGCSVTNDKSFHVLLASHIKPWAISSNRERLDWHNGFLLTPNLLESTEFFKLYPRFF